MNTLSIFRRLYLAAFFIGAPAPYSVHAQPALQPAPALLEKGLEAENGMGLPRLTTGRQDRPRLAASSYIVESIKRLSASGRLTARGGNEFFALDSNREWALPLRTNLDVPIFASVLITASAFAEVTVGPARVTIVPDADSKFVTLHIPLGVDGNASQPLGVSAPLEPFDGLPMVALPVLTFRIDPHIAVWDLYYGDQLLVSAQAVPSSFDYQSSKLIISGGDMGTWIHGVVQAKESPLFVDANQNGIPDPVEISVNGSLSANSLSPQRRASLIEAWRAQARSLPREASVVRRPAPDTAK